MRKMAQPPPDQNFYHHPSNPHAHPSHQHSHSQHAHAQHAQLQLPPQFRNPFDLLFDERYNYIRPYLPNQMPNPDELSDSLVMRRPRRTRTTFTSSQVAELEQHFLQGRYLTAPRLADLSAKLALGTAQVKIWFKNRRRRHKIQSDQYKDHSFEGMMPLSPTMPLKDTVDPPSLQALSLSNGTPNALTPSPTPSTPTAQLVEQYSESLNAYYSNYNNNNNNNQQGQRLVSQLHAAYGAGASTRTEFFSSQQQQLHQQQPRSQQQLHHHQLLQRQQRQQQQQQQYQHFDFQQKNRNPCRLQIVKREPDNDSDYNFNGSYYMRSTALSSNGVGIDSGMASALSPGSEVYEPLTPKNDESPSLCGGGTSAGDGGGSSSSVGVGGTSANDTAASIGADDADISDDMDDGPNKKTTTLQTLEPLKSNNNEDVAKKNCDDGTDILSAGLLAVARGSRIGSNSAFGKFGIQVKTQAVAAAAAAAAAEAETAASTSGSSPMDTTPETSQYQCTMDTIMQAYNRNATGNSQFAFCFN